MTETNKSPILCQLAEALAALSPRLPPAEAAQEASDAARLVVKAMTQTNESSILGCLAKALAALAPRLPPAEAAQEASDAARMVVKGMAKNHDPYYVVSHLAEALAALAPRMPPTEAAEESSDAVRLVVKAIGETNDRDALRALTESVAALIVKVEPGENSQRINALTGAVGNASAPSALFAEATPLAVASRPLPGRFPEQQLVDLLKMPSCRREAREVIVAQLGNQCGRSFANLWEFVDYAREHRPDLDLTSPPIRPDSP